MSIIDLEKSLSELHKELVRLTPATELAEKAVETVNLAKAIPARHQQLIKELKSVFINPDENERKEFVNVYSSISNLLGELHKIMEAINEFGKKISELVEYLKNNDIPKKLEAINFQLTSINNSLLAVQGQLNAIQTSLNSISNTVDNIRQNSEKILSEVKVFRESVEKRQDNQEKEIKTLKTILIIICGLIVIGSIATILVLK